MAELIFNLSKEGKCAFSLPESQVPSYEIDRNTQGRRCISSEVSEVDVIRHFTDISRNNYGVDQGFILWDRTMKYNPKVNEDVAGIQFSLHPYQPNIRFKVRQRHMNWAGIYVR